MASSVASNMCYIDSGAFCHMIGNKGYGVMFIRGKALLKPLDSGANSFDGVRVMNFYMLQFVTIVTLSNKEINVHRCDLGELWHRHMGHLHHGVLIILREIAIGLPE